MERISNTNGENGLGNGLEISGCEAWDAVPRDGPAVFVVDSVAFDHGVVRGRWLDIDVDQEVLHDELTELLGRKPEEGAWAIVDQVGLGQLMAPETMTVTDLSTLADDLTAERLG